MHMHITITCKRLETTLNQVVEQLQQGRRSEQLDRQLTESLDVRSSNKDDYYCDSPYS